MRFRSIRHIMQEMENYVEYKRKDDSMSLLNQRCNYYLKITGHTTHTFAKSTGLDVTEVHRLVNGSRLPSLDFLRVFCASLRINEAERREILNLYEEESTGHAIYQNRRYITQMISSLAVGENLPLSFSAPFEDSRDKRQAYTLLCDVLEEAFSQSSDSSEIYCNFPADFPFPFLSLLLHLYQKYSRQKKTAFRHLITFSSNPAVQTDSNCNLKILRQIFPLISSGCEGYSPFYIYTHASASDFFQIPWSCCLATERAVLLLSSDCSLSILHRDPGKVQWYRMEMKRLLQTAMPLISCSTSAAESLTLYSRYSRPCHPIFGYLAYQPCLMPCMAPDHLAKGLSGIKPPAGLLKLLSSSGFCLPAAKAPSYFSRDGLLSFWQTGKLSGQLAGYFPAFSPEERRTALLNFVQKNNGRDESSRMITLDIPFPSSLYIELLQNHRLLICLFGEEASLRFILLDESSIYDAFTDFFQYLGTSENSLSVSETNRFIISLLENSQTGGVYHV